MKIMRHYCHYKQLNSYYLTNKELLKRVILSGCLSESKSKTVCQDSVLDPLNLLP